MIFYYETPICINWEKPIRANIKGNLKKHTIVRRKKIIRYWLSITLNKHLKQIIPLHLLVEFALSHPFSYFQFSVIKNYKNKEENKLQRKYYIIYIINYYYILSISSLMFKVCFWKLKMWNQCVTDASRSVWTSRFSNSFWCFKPIAFASENGWKLYPKILDNAFLRWYLCSVVTHHFNAARCVPTLTNLNY